MRYSLYTDGSFKQKKCASAFRWLDIRGEVILQGSEIIKRGNSAYESELCAVIYGLELIPPNATNVTVLTDCLDIVEFWSGKISTRKCKKLRFLEEDLLTMKQHSADIQFKWVKGHSGNRNNEAMDKLAKKTVDKELKKKKKGRRKKKW